MKFPKYNEFDLRTALKDGNYPVSDFADFLSQLQEQDLLQTNVEKGIVAFAISNGTEFLSDKQSNVLDIIISRYENKECMICGTARPLNEAIDYDGYCSYHSYHKDDED